MARLWARIIMVGMGFPWKVEGEENILDGKNYMFVANHTSITDVTLMLLIVKNHPFVFVGKKELAKYPFFGFIFKRVCIMVDRSCKKSRAEVFESAQKRINQGLSICIFPEGGIPEEHIVLDEFKDGAFRIAIDHGLTILPMVFYDNKKRFSYTFFSGSPGLMRAKILPSFETKGLNHHHKEKLKSDVRELILNELTSNS